MPLSTSKLENLLISKGFIPRKFFVMEGTCFYIEIFSTHTADFFLLYIPSKYNFKLEHGENIYSIKQLVMEDSQRYGAESNPEDHYERIELPIEDKVEERLEAGYRKQISLKDVSEGDIIDLRAIYRQVKRLKYCVENLNYKIGVIYKNYICAIRRDNSINCFVLKHHPRVDVKKIVVIVDLETFYEKGEKTAEELRIVRDSLYQVLERNQGMHGRVINNMIENKGNIALIPQLAEQKKIKYEQMLVELENLLQIMNEAENSVNEQLETMRKNSEHTIQSDINRVHQKTKLDKELNRIIGIKGELTRNIIALRERRENAVLNIDKIMFDNTVMFDAMIKNFAKMKDYC